MNDAAKACCEDPRSAGPAPVVRQLWPFDRPEIRAHVLRLSSEERRLRFFAYQSDAALESVVDAMDWSRTLFLGAFVEQRLRGLAELHFSDWRPGCTAELALTVEGDFQGRGIGRALLRRISTFARNRWLGSLEAIFLQENRRMRALAAGEGLQVQPSYDDVRAEARLSAPTPFSLLEEGLGEMTAFSFDHPGFVSLPFGTVQPARQV